MAEPIVFISRWRIRQGKRAALEAMFAQSLGFIGSTKPRTALFAAYLDEAGEELRFVHAVPDAAAMTDHFEGSEERSASGRGHDRALRLRGLRRRPRGRGRPAAPSDGWRPGSRADAPTDLDGRRLCAPRVWTRAARMRKKQQYLASG